MTLAIDVHTNDMRRSTRQMRVPVTDAMRVRLWRWALWRCSHSPDWLDLDPECPITRWVYLHHLRAALQTRNLLRES